MELFKLFGTIAVDNANANKGIDETTGKASGAQTKIVESFKKIGKAVVTYFAVDKIVDFGKACLDAAANAQAMESQFSQVFGDLEGDASAKLSAIADTAGITENRMKGSFTKIAAFAKTTGMDTEDALALSERAMIAVADSAAFYDRTLEETTESLQSFLKGNFENDAALGLSCTETTRNAAANKLYGKSFKDLSEEQKQLTLLKMVEDANKTSGALGQAARESDTWTNQIGNLKQAWVDFKAMVGSNFLDPAVSGVKVATSAIQKMQDVVSDLFEGWREVVAPAAADVGAAFGNIWTALEPVREAIANLFSESTGISSAWDIIRAVLYFLEDALLNVADGLNSVSLWVAEKTPQITSFITTMWETIKTAWDSIGKPVFNFVLDLIGIVRDTFAQHMPEIRDFVSQVFSDIQLFWEENLQPCFEAIGNFIENILAPIFKSVFETHIKGTIDTVFKAIKSFWESTLKPVFTGITDFLTGVFTLNWEQAWEGVKSILTGILNGIIGGIEWMINGAINALNGLIEGINQVISLAGSLLGLSVKIPLIPSIELPRLEEGGILERGQIGLLEGNGAEAVVPLDQNQAWISAVARDMEAAGIGGNYQQGERIIALLEMLVDMLPDTLKDAFASMKFDINNREFARMVKVV